MKELKFRVYDKDLGKYLEGCEIDSLMADLCSEGDGRAVIIKQLCPARYIFEQYTGLKDKNGKEIYAGDIVSEHNGDIVGKIIQKPSGEYCIAWIGIFGGSSVLYDELSMCEVIGNINENPGFLVENNGEKD